MTSFTTGKPHSESDPASDSSASSAPSAPDAERESAGEDVAPGEPQAGRARLVEARIEHEPGSRLHVTVALERGDRVCEEELRGVGDSVMALRMAAEATLSALDCLTGHPGYFKLVGIKTIRAFDAEFVLVCVRTTSGRPRSLMGSVPATGDLTRGAAMAVLHATNRLAEILIPQAESR